MLIILHHISVNVCILKALWLGGHHSTSAYPVLIVQLVVQVHPGLSVKIQSHTQSPVDKHTPMHVSWNENPTAKPANTVIGAKTQAHVMQAAAPAAGLHQHNESPTSAGQSPSPRAMASDEVDHTESAKSALHQQIQDATTKSISSAAEALSLMQPALGLQPISTANSLLLNGSSTSPQPEVGDATTSDQVHMGFNHSVIHDSSESHGFASVNSTDVVPISDMPDAASDSPDNSVDWAQEFGISASDDLTPLAAAIADEEDMESELLNFSASSPDSATSAAHVPVDITRPHSALHDGTIASSNEAFIATQSTETETASSSKAEVSSEVSGSESPKPEELSPEVAATAESAWIQVDPYSDNLQGMIHPSSRIFRAPGK